MSNKLYFGNLSFRVTSEDLQEYFGAAGSVESANVVIDRETGRSRGFGFVEMASEDDGRNIVVNEARPREDRGFGGGGGNNRGRGGHNGGGGRGDRW